MAWDFDIVANMIKKWIHDYTVDVEETVVTDLLTNLQSEFFDKKKNKFREILEKSQQIDYFPVDTLFYFLDSFKRRLDLTYTLNLAGLEEISMQSMITALKMSSEKVYVTSELIGKIYGFERPYSEEQKEQLHLAIEAEDKHLTALNFELELDISKLNEMLLDYTDTSILNEINNDFNKYEYRDKEIFFDMFDNVYQAHLKNLMLNQINDIENEEPSSDKNQVIIDQISKLENIFQLKNLLATLKADEFSFLTTNDSEAIFTWYDLVQNLQNLALNFAQNDPNVNIIDKPKEVQDYINLFKEKNKEESSDDSFLKTFNELLTDRLQIKVKKTEIFLSDYIANVASISTLHTLILNMNAISALLKNTKSSIKENLSAWDVIINNTQGHAITLLTEQLRLKHAKLSNDDIFALQKIFNYGHDKEKLSAFNKLFNKNVIEISECAIDNFKKRISQATDFQDLRVILADLYIPEFVFLKNSIVDTNTNITGKDKIISLLQERADKLNSRKEIETELTTYNEIFNNQQTSHAQILKKLSESPSKSLPNLDSEKLVVTDQANSLEANKIHSPPEKEQPKSVDEETYSTKLKFNK